MSKVIGILGGMGPLATVFLYKKIVDTVEAKKDQDYPRIIIDNNSKIPDRTNYILYGVEDPTEALVESAKMLKNAGSDFLIMPCNTAHYFIDRIKEEVDIEFINLLKLTAEKLKENDVEEIYLFATEGTNKSHIYGNVFEKYGINLKHVSKEQQTLISHHIYNIKSYNFSYQEDFEKLIKEYKGENILLACSELSVINDSYDLEGNIYDTMEFLANEAIIKAGYQTKQ